VISAPEESVSKQFSGGMIQGDFCMKLRLGMVTLSVAVGLAVGQAPPPNPPAQETPKPAQENTKPAQENTKPAQENTKADSKPDAKTGAATTPGGTPLAEMKTTNFKGVLVDMACASRSSSSAETKPATAETKPATAETKPANAETKPAASDTGGSCPVSASSSEIGMKLEDGKTVRFDMVGNQRAQDLLKNDKRWSKDISANKPIRAKVSGVLNGDKLIVAAIH
jgi:hypothetical protein